MTFPDFRSHTNHLFIEHNLLKAREIIKLQHLQLTYSFLQNTLPTDLIQLFKLKEAVHSHQTRQVFHVPSVNTSTYGIYLLKYLCPNLWNNTWKNGLAIDNDYSHTIYANQIFSVHQLKRALKKHFLFNYSK